MRIIQVGMGGWGRNWAKNIVLPSDEVELAACVDTDAATLARAREEVGVAPEQCFSTLAAALENVEADAVLITANLPAHVAVAREALGARKHVLLEKPFAASLAEARSVVELAEVRDRVLMISQNYRFYPAVQVAAALIREGTLGPVGAVAVDFRRYSNTAPVEGHRHYGIRQPLLIDMAIHHFDLMRAVLGQQPVSIACHAWNPPWSRFVEPAAAFATIQFDGGAIVSYRGSWVSPGPQTAWAGEWRVECAKGEIVWTSRANAGLDADKVTLRLIGKRARRVKLPAMEKIDRAGSLHAFTAAVQSGRPPQSSGRDNLGSIALMNAAVESATSGLPLPIPAT